MTEDATEVVQAVLDASTSQIIQANRLIASARNIIAKGVRLRPDCNDEMFNEFRREATGFLDQTQMIERSAS